jgi:hypothetical protein
MMNDPPSRWIYDEGVLVVYHLGKTVSLGSYATHALAAKAAAAYFAEHGGRKESTVINLKRTAK